MPGLSGQLVVWMHWPAAVSLPSAWNGAQYAQHAARNTRDSWGACWLGVCLGTAVTAARYQALHGHYGKADARRTFGEVHQW